MNDKALKKEALAEAEVKNKEGKADKPAKKTPPTPKPKEGKPKAGVNEWGHRIGSQSAQIDEAVKKHLAKRKTLEVARLLPRRPTYRRPGFQFI